MKPAEGVKWWDWPALVRDSRVVPRAHYALLLTLATYADNQGVAWPSVETLASNCRVSERQMRRQLHQLAEDGFVTLQRYGHGKLNAYQLIVSRISPDTMMAGQMSGESQPPAPSPDTQMAGEQDMPKTLHRTFRHPSPDILEISPDISATTIRMNLEHRTVEPTATPGPAPDQNPEPVTPDMVAGAVMVELGISGRDLRNVLEGVIVAHAKRPGYSPESIRDRMIAAWREYQAKKPTLAFQWGGKSFFGEGHWEDPRGWPYKDSQDGTPKPAVYATITDDMRAVYELRQKRLRAQREAATR